MKQRLIGLTLTSFLSGALVGSFIDGYLISRIKPLVKAAIQGGQFDKFYDSKALNEKWAKNLVKGGYILHIRHGMREKFSGSVTTYDAIEILNKDDARNTDYYRAVCLTERGILDSKVIGKTFDLAGIKVSHVLSSPSCRARETAIFAFNRIDQIEPSILHRSAQMTSQHKRLGDELRAAVDAVPIKKGTNIVVSGHVSTLSYDHKNKTGIVDINETDGDLDSRLETGIVVIERKGSKYIARHKFKSIKELSTNILELPVQSNGFDKFLFKPGDKYKPAKVNRGLIYNPNHF